MGLAGLAGTSWLLILALAEARSIPGPERFVVERRMRQKLSLGEPSAVLIKVSNFSKTYVDFRLVDLLPSALVSNPEYPQLTLRVAARESAQVGYTVIPSERGQYDLLHVDVQVHGRLGLAMRQFRIPQPHSIRVYPCCPPAPHKGLSQRQVLQQTGERKFRLPGQGTDFDHLRNYNMEDDVRSIDWKATARCTVPVVRCYQMERHQTVLLALDAGRLMSARAGGRAKFEWCLEGSCALAQAALLRGDHVGVLCYADRVLRYVPPRGGANHLQTILESLYSLQPLRCESLHDRALAYLRTHHRKRALIAAFTDLADPVSARRLAENLSPFRPTHLPLLITVRDQELVSLATSMPAGQGDLYRVAVANELWLEREETLLQMRQRGILTIDCAAQSLKAETLQTYLDIKLRNRL